MDLDFLCLGDAAQDNFYFLDEAEAAVHCELRTESCELALKYGQKIPVGKYAVSLGGNAANVSVGLARLGIKTALATEVGDDERGAWVKRELLKERVDLGLSPTVPGRQTSTSAIIVYQDERTILSYHDSKKFASDIGMALDRVGPCQCCQWLYLTSGAGSDLYVATSDRITQHTVENKKPKLAFNPGMREIERGKGFLQPILAVATALILNREEGGEIMRQIIDKGYKIKEKTIEEIAKELKELGPEIVVVTDGANGAAVFDGKSFWQKPALDVPILETTGAGDAFSSGFLAGLYYKKSLTEALDWGLKNSASVIQKIGAIEGLLTRTGIMY